jgi:hypothetical protein
MNRTNKRDRTVKTQATFLIAGIACLATTAGAQGLISTTGQILATNGGQVPGMPAGVVWGGTSTFDSGVLDDSGNILFRGRFQDPLNVAVPALTALNDRAYFVGTTPGNLAMSVRSGDPAPGLSPLTLNTATGTGLTGSPRLGPDGRAFISAALPVITGNGVTSANDSALFGGPLSSLVLIAREGTTIMPGGALLATSLSGLSHQPTGMNRNGNYLFQASTLTGGDVVGTTNNAAWITGTVGSAPVYAVRKGDLIGGAPITALGFISQLNNAGQLMTEVTLSTSTGSPPASIATDRALLIWTPGSGFAVAVREGDTAPGTSGGTFSTPTSNWTVSAPANAFTSDGKGMTTLNVLGGDTAVGFNDTAVYFVSATNPPQLALRRGDAAPGTDGYIDIWNQSNCGKGNNDLFFIQGTIAGGTSTTANNSGIWCGTPGNLQLVVREGDILPGTVATEMVGSINGAGDNGFGSRFAMMSSGGQIYFETDLINGDAAPGSSQAWMCWDANTGLHILARQGEQIQVSPGVFKNLSSEGSIQFSNGDGSPLGFSATGLLAERLNFDDGTGAIITVQVPTLPGSAFCSGDGTGTACPCGNNSAVGAKSGCLNSLGSGGKLTASGYASLGNDSVVLTGSGMPNSSALYFQGTTQQSGGLGALFGDGLRCAGGSVIRLGTKSNAAGGSSYPVAGDLRVSVKGLVTTPGLRTYQCWYRNSAVFCVTNATYNLTNGWQLTWGL